MAEDRVSATTVVNAPAEAIFAALADPAKHAASDGTPNPGRPPGPPMNRGVVYRLKS